MSALGIKTTTTQANFALFLTANTRVVFSILGCSQIFDLSSTVVDPCSRKLIRT